MSRRHNENDVSPRMKEVLPNSEEMECFNKELLEIMVDVTEFLPSQEFICG